MIDYEEYKQIAEIIEVEVNTESSDYRRNVEFGNASARFLSAYKKYAKADQPTQKSCEGCEHNDTNFECTADFDCFNFEHYQARKK